MKELKIAKSEQRILDTLNAENRELSATELAELAKIDIKNFSKSTKKLITNSLILERPEQNGKIRTKYYSIAPEAPAPEPVDKTSESKIPETGIPVDEPPKPSIEQDIAPPVTFKPKIEPQIKESVSKRTKKITSKRIKEILSAQKPEVSADRKANTDYYLKKLLLKGFEDFLQQSDKKIRIISE